MTHTTCPSCRLRFARDLTAKLDLCPLCAKPLVRTSSAHATLGYPLFDDAPAHAPQDGSPAGSGYAALVAALRKRS